MAKPCKVRDPVHNFVHLERDEVRLVDTPIFQRLRGIRQLAMANLVYPGALHTRFDHSLGVCHVAGLMAEELELPASDQRLVRLAALLHDLGHGPFSHVSEISLERFADRTKLPPEMKKEKIHELVTAHYIRHDPDLNRELGKATCERVVKLLSEGHGEPALRNLVSGPLDADKQDYLLRDSRYCGVTYGVFDIHQLHRSLTLVGPQVERELMITPEGVSAVEQFVLAKYYMTLNVYRHRVRLITDQMLARAIQLGIEADGIEELDRLYRFEHHNEAFFRNYQKWDDARFLREFSDEQRYAGKLCHELVRRLTDRRLLKLVFSDRIDRFSGLVRESLPRLMKPDQAPVRGKFEAVVADAVDTNVHGDPINKKLVAVNAFDIKSVRVMSRNDEAGILVDRPGGPRPFEEESALFRSISLGYSESCPCRTRAAG
jgi:HD superfamily phosphohydrolase